MKERCDFWDIQSRGPLLAIDCREVQHCQGNTFLGSTLPIELRFVGLTLPIIIPMRRLNFGA